MTFRENLVKPLDDYESPEVHEQTPSEPDEPPRASASSKAPQTWSLDDHLFNFSPTDAFTTRMAVSGWSTSGMTGAGKSTGPGATFLDVAFENGWGALLHCNKAVDAQEYADRAAKCGRSDDTVVFDADSGFCYDFMADAAADPSGAGQVENLVHTLTQLLEISGSDPHTAKGSSGEQQFWKDVTRKTLRACCDLSLKATGTVDVQAIYHIILSAPHSLADSASPEFQQSSFCYQLIEQARNQPLDPSAAADLHVTETFFLEEYATLPDRTRSSATLSTLTMLDLLLRGNLRDVFCSGETNLHPSLLGEGAVIILAWPTLQMQQIGRLAQVIYKLAFMRWVQGRDGSSDTVRPIAYFSDEYPLTALSTDPQFLAVCRSSRTAAFLCWQTLPLLEKALGSPEAAQALLGNLGTRCHLTQVCHKTNEWAVSAVGKQFYWRGNVSKSDNVNMYPQGGGGSEGSSIGGSMVYDYPEDFHPGLFHRLTPGGKGFVDSYIVKPGEPFNHNGNKNYLFVRWEQR